MSGFDDLNKVETKKRNDGTVLPNLTDEELKIRSEQISMMTEALSVRDSSHPEFDDMGYRLRYETNQKADNSYIPPKLNKNDVRIVTGVTREKDNSLLAALLNYNFECSITAFDGSGNEVDELGIHMADLVRKSREVEIYDGKRDLIYRELIAQGDVFMLEMINSKYRVDRKVDFDWSDGVSFARFKSSESVELDYKRPECTIIPGTKIILGNIREPEIDKQPFVVMFEDVPYNECRNQFQKWDRWGNVPTTIQKTVENTDVGMFRDWSLVTCKGRYVQKIWFMDRPNNIVQLYLNGIPMLPLGFPLSEFSPSGEYPIACGSCERMPFFAYSKGMPEKMKVDQAIFDEMMKLAVLKTQQSFKPTIVNNSNRELSPDIHVAGAVLDDVDPDKVRPLFVPTGVTNSEMAFMDYMKEIMDLKSVSATFSGEQPAKGMTATQVIEMKKAQMSKLGLIIWGVVQFEQRANWLRLQNILRYGLGDSQSETYLKKIKQAIVDTIFDNGAKGKRVFEFVDGETVAQKTSAMVRMESELLSVKNRVETRKVYLSLDEIRKSRLIWQVTIVPTEKNTTELQQMMIASKIRDAIGLFGPQSLNQEYWREIWSMKNEIDPKRAFIQTQMPMLPMGGGQANQATGLENGLGSALANTSIGQGTAANA